MNAVQLKNEAIAALKALPELERDAVTLVCCMNLIEREAAQLLGITRHRFRTVFHSAMKKLNCRWKPEPVSPVLNATDSEIEAAMKTLPELERRSIELMYYEGLHERDAAKQLGVTRNKLRMALNEGLHRLKTQFNVVP